MHVLSGERHSPPPPPPPNNSEQRVGRGWNGWFFFKHQFSSTSHGALGKMGDLGKPSMLGHRMELTNP